MTPEQTTAARERCEKATPGPWYFTEDDNKEILVSDSIESQDENPVPVLEYGELGDVQIRINWDFVEHARIDLPLALDALTAKDARIAELERENAELKAANALCGTLLKDVSFAVKPNEDPRYLLAYHCSLLLSEIQQLVVDRSERDCLSAALKVAREAIDVVLSRPGNKYSEIDAPLKRLLAEIGAAIGANYSGE